MSMGLDKNVKGTSSDHSKNDGGQERRTSHRNKGI